MSHRDEVYGRSESPQAFGQRGLAELLEGFRGQTFKHAAMQIKQSVVKRTLRAVPAPVRPERAHHPRFAILEDLHDIEQREVGRRPCEPINYFSSGVSAARLGNLRPGGQNP